MPACLFLAATAGLLGSGAAQGTQPDSPAQLTLNRELRGMEFIQYWLRDHLRMAEGSVRLEMVVRFPAEEALDPEKGDSGKATHTFLTFILDKGNRVSVCYDRFRRAILFFAYDRPTQRHLILETLPVQWRNGEAHSVEVEWGSFLVLRLDDRKVVSRRWQGLAGPWAQTEPRDAYLLVGSIRLWAHTQSDFLVQRLTFRRRSQGLRERLADRAVQSSLCPVPRLTIPRLTQAPVIDGSLEDPAWNQAAGVTGLVNVQSMTLMAEPTVVLVGYDAARLYIGVRAFRQQAQLIDTACHVRDGAVYLDDALEVFLRPQGRGPYYQFIGNSFGTIYDAYDGKPGWNGPWEFKTVRADRFWSAEAAIGWSALGGAAPQPGDVWTMNFCRDMPSMSEIASWAVLHGSYDQPERFAQATFSDQEAARLEEISGWERGRLTLRLGSTCAGRARIAVGDGAAVLVSREMDKGPGTAVLSLDLPPLLAEGEHLLAYEMRSSDGRVLLSGVFPFSTLAPFDLTLRQLPSFGYVEAVIDTRGLAQWPPGAKARARLVDPAGRTMAVQETAGPSADGLLALRLATADLNPGEYEVRGELVDSSGRVVHSRTIPLTRQPAAWWLGSRAGLTDQVLPPWTPMVVEGTTIGCWGRRIAFGQSVFPERIVSQERDLLAGPMRCTAVCGGQTLELRQGRCQVTQAAAHAVELTATAQAGPLSLSARIQAEYDGLIRFDLALEPAGAVLLERLTLEIPLAADHSILMHENDGGQGWAGLTGDEPRRMIFRPTIWLGDDYRGLCWFAESSQGWQPASAGAIEITRDGPRRYLRLHLVRETLRLTEALRYTFGLMPTPVRPVPAHVRAWRLATGIASGRGHTGREPVVFPERITYPAAGQWDNRQGTLEVWFRPAWPAGAEEANPYRVWQEIAAVEYGPFLDKSQVAVFYAAPDERLVVTHATYATDAPSGRRQRVERRLLTGVPTPLSPDQDYHLALVWGEELALYLNGQKIASRAQAGLVPDQPGPTLPEQTLILGAHDEWTGRTAFLFDELRVSSRARPADDLKAGRPVRDPATVLLDHFSETFRPDGEDGRTHPEVAAGPEAGGVPTLGCTFVPARFGTGARVVVRPPQAWLTTARTELGLTHVADWGWGKYMGAWELLASEEQHRANVEAVHAAGLQYYVYTYKALAPRHPHYDVYFHEWGLMPRVRWIDPGTAPDARNYDADSTCANSPYTDYFVAGYERAVKQYDLDGIYLDGNTKPALCTNAHHGCGYRDAQGQWRGRYPIFATRQMLKRLYAVTHLNKPEGIVDVHESFCLCIPTTSFCDVIYTGEHEPFSPERLDEIRVRYAWRAWGLPIEVLGSTPHHVYYTARYWAYMLLHDARVRPAGTNGRHDMQRKTANIRRVLEPFRGPDCRWWPYYEPSPFAPMDKDLYVSAWSRPAGDWLLAVAYFGRSAARITGRIRLGLEGSWRATNALTEEPLRVQEAVLQVPIEFERFRLVHLTPTPR